jgi:saccharopine dehydrogenase-like NADP-dependent oxidoreductase
MKYVVLGAGLQGPAVAYALAKKIPSSYGNIFLCEVDKPRMDRAKWLFKDRLAVELDDNQGVTLVKVEMGQPPLDLFRNIDDLTVVSTLPYNLNLAVATECIKRGWRYYDLGGHIQTTTAIEQAARKASSDIPVMTDLGMAPGLVNVIGEYSMDQVKEPHALFMRCGGLPIDPEVNHISYKITFSSQGLFNEYFNDCQALVNGEIVDVEPMGDARIFEYGGYMYESFNTSGAGHTTIEVAKARGLKDARYQTVRYLGHMRTVRFLKEDVGMTDEQLAKLFDAKVGMTTEDKLLISVSCAGTNGVWVWEHEIFHDENFTAMQRGTGFSAAAMVLATQDITGKSILTYADCPAPKVFDNLKGLLEIKL